MNQLSEIPVLNWFENDKFTDGLRKLFSKRNVGGIASFVTMRLGPKWANNLNPGQKVAISISNDPENPRIIGNAEVKLVKKSSIAHLSKNDLVKNIGAKTKEAVLKAMQDVYKTKVNYHTDTVSVLELFTLD